MSVHDDEPTEDVPVSNGNPGDRLVLAYDREDDWVEIVPEYGESIIVPARDLLAAVTRLIPTDPEAVTV